MSSGNGGARSALLAVVGLAAAGTVAAPTAAAAPEAPFLAYGAHNLIVGFEADPAAVRALLPAGLEPAGSVVHLNMYAVPTALGVPAYDRSYVWVDVVGHDAWDGTKGRFVLVGWAEPAGFRETATADLRWPAGPGRTSIAQDGGRVRAELALDGEVALRAHAAVGAGGEAAAQTVTAMLPYVFVEPEGAQGAATVGVNQVAFAGRVRPLAAPEIELGPAATEALRALRPLRVVSAVEVQDGAFVLGVQKPSAAGRGG